MTQRVISIRRNGEMRLKAVVGCNGGQARFVVEEIKRRYGPRGGQPSIGVPTGEELYELCLSHDFGCRDCLVVLEYDPAHHNVPKMHGAFNEDLEENIELKNLYLDTFHVAQFNPRWKFGTADYVEVIDL